MPFNTIIVKLLHNAYNSEQNVTMSWTESDISPFLSDLSQTSLVKVSN